MHSHKNSKKSGREPGTFYHVSDVEDSDKLMSAGANS